MKHYVSKEAVCPFYHKEEGNKIHCEGFCKTCNLQTTFSRRELLYVHKQIHCNSFEGYPKCPLYEIINKQYTNNTEEK